MSLSARFAEIAATKKTPVKVSNAPNVVNQQKAKGKAARAAQLDAKRAGANKSQAAQAGKKAGAKAAASTAAASEDGKKKKKIKGAKAAAAAVVAGTANFKGTCNTCGGVGHKSSACPSGTPAAAAPAKKEGKDGKKAAKKGDAKKGDAKKGDAKKGDAKKGDGKKKEAATPANQEDLDYQMASYFHKAGKGPDPKELKLDDALAKYKAAQDAAKKTPSLDDKDL